MCMCAYTVCVHRMCACVHTWYVCLQGTSVLMSPRQDKASTSKGKLMIPLSELFPISVTSLSLNGIVAVVSSPRHPWHSSDTFLNHRFWTLLYLNSSSTGSPSTYTSLCSLHSDHLSRFLSVFSILDGLPCTHKCFSNTT